MKNITFIVVSALLAACGAIPVSSYEGQSTADVRKPGNKAELIDALGMPDVQTADGRFYLYALDKVTAWHIVVFGMPGEAWLTTTTAVRALYEFDIDNRFARVAIHACDDEFEDPVCNRDPDTALWAMIESELGPEFVTRYRHEDHMNRQSVDAWQAAVLASDMHQIDELLAKGASIRLEHEGANALHFAAANDNVAMIEHLLARGLPIEALDSRRAATPLDFAARSGALEATRLLIRHGANPNARDFSGNTPLHGAVVSDNLQLSDFLIAHGAEVNARASDGRTPLYIAVARQQRSTVELFLSRGADVDTHPENGETALASAAQSGAAEILRLLLSHGADPDDRGSFWNGDTPLILAVKADRLETAKILIEHGANVNKGGSWSMPLHHAVTRGNRDMVELLLASGADVNDRTRIPDNSRKYVKWRRVTPLEIAVENSDEAIASLLRDHGGRL